MLKYTLSISLYRRPFYTKILLDALNRCYNIDKYQIFISCDVYYYTAFDTKNLRNNSLASLDLAQKFRPHQTQVIKNEPILGCNNNIYQCLNIGFNNNNDFHIHLEDDTIPSKDILLYFEWARNEFRYDENIFSVCGYSKSETNVNDFYYDKVGKSHWFSPWGWGTWKDRYLEIEQNIHNCLFKGWDEKINHCTRKNRYQIFPHISRIQNIGALDGENVSEDYHRKHQYNQFWIENLKKYSYSFSMV